MNRLLGREVGFRDQILGSLLARIDVTPQVEKHLSTGARRLADRHP